LRRRSSNRRILLLIVWVFACALLFLLSLPRFAVKNGILNPGSYETLKPDTSSENALKYINADFSVEKGFHTNLPIVILETDGELPQYKYFVDNGMEIADEDIEPYTTGRMTVISHDGSDNTPWDAPVYDSAIKIKKRGHTSMAFDKPQYKIKALLPDGTYNDTSILGMGEGNDWILNGSLADKSMLRNYLAYRICSEVGGNRMSPDSRFCEVIFRNGNELKYQGVYLLTESIDVGRERVNIQKTGNKTTYTSYIIRRDRQTAFDVMLNTYGRRNGFSEQYIGIKYPGKTKLTESLISYIERDYSLTEEILYSDKLNEYRMYSRFIDVDSFADYFLLNEFFGNYDAGEHSTYMFKDSGSKLCIGPVWDFDQAMNNNSFEEMDTKSIAFHTKPLFDRLILDRKFINILKSRYTVLRSSALKEEHINDIIAEARRYLRSATKREWFRYAADYVDYDNPSPGNYYLQGYLIDGIAVSRMNDNYDQEIYNIRNYLHKHALVIQDSLTKLYDSTEFNTSPGGYNVYFLILLFAVFSVPSLIINQRK